jgi:2-C-methyl-D-erythritol 4-phosphate cytidylyltransferase
MNCTAIIVAAGSGSRMGRKDKKQFITLCGQPVLQWTLDRFQASDDIHEIVLVGPEQDIGRLQALICRAKRYDKLQWIVPGGQERHDSVKAGLDVADPKNGIVLIHDGVRPFVTPEMISATIHAAARRGAALVAVPPKDTIKTIRDGLIGETLDRGSLCLVQTPQAFQRHLILEAYRQRDEQQRDCTDDAALVEALGYEVEVVHGAYSNIKITSPEDLLLAERIAEQYGWG